MIICKQSALDRADILLLRGLEHAIRLLIALLGHAFFQLCVEELTELLEELHGRYLYLFAWNFTIFCSIVFVQQVLNVI